MADRRNLILGVVLSMLILLLLSLQAVAQGPPTVTYELTRDDITKALVLAAYENGLLKMEAGKTIEEVGSELGIAYLEIVNGLKHNGGWQASLDLALALLARNGEMQFHIESPGQIADMYDNIVAQCGC